MSSFKQKIRIGNFRSLEFSFIKVYTVSGLTWFVSTIDEAHEVYSFSMKQEDHVWKVIQPSELPEWIIAVEPDLSMAIVEYFSS